eukprot:1880026-Ditylum_brightwellii.AAC.1
MAPYLAVQQLVWDNYPLNAAGKAAARRGSPDKEFYFLLRDELYLRRCRQCWDEERLFLRSDECHYGNVTAGVK